MEKGEAGRRLTQVIIPTLNEEQGIGLTIAELRSHLNEARILVVDGRSSDRTVEVAKNTGADILFQDGLGKGDAIAKAIECADLAVDYVVFTDADYTYPAETLPSMVQILEENPRVGMVLGNRFNRYLSQSEALHSVYHFGNRLIAFTHNLLNGVLLKDPLTGLRVIRAEILRDWVVKSKSFDVEVELNHLVERKGFGIVEVPIKYRQRVGQKKLKIADGATIFKRIMLETTY
ncbi:MAG: glycosyltransferase family 2 protein [Candidatus Bathyarchaeota archaeon]|nr:glycosyltransferase family 2 protein [Candidatus Bathyarchaeota archaeon]